MQKHLEVVRDLACQCGAGIIKSGKLTCPRCHQSVNMTLESDVVVDEQGRWKCQKCLEHGRKPRTLAVGDAIKCRQCDIKNSLIQKEEQEVTESGKKWIELSCKEARLLLKVIPVDKKDAEMSEEEGSAAAHFVQCRTCAEVGLSEILSKHLSCQEALEIWARKSAHIGLGVIETIREKLAVEHVWGRWKDIRDKGNNLLWRDPNFGACEETSCAALRHYWNVAPLSIFNDGEREAALVIPFIMNIFIEQKWPIKRLLELQRERMLVLLGGLVNNELLAEVYHQGHYHTPEDVRREIEEGISALQKIILDGRKEK